MGSQVLRKVQQPILRSTVGRWLLDRSVVVFLYHEVSDHPSEFNRDFGIWVTPKTFERHLGLVQEQFEILDPDRLISGRFRTPAALVTFDDGNRSYFEQALPILRQKGIPSVMFLNMATVRNDPCWSGLVTYLQRRDSGFYQTRVPRPMGADYCRFTEEEVQRYLAKTDAAALLEKVRRYRGEIATEAEVARAARDPLVFLGNHLYNHVNAVESPDRLSRWYRQNQAALDDLPQGRRLFSYPFGRWDRRSSRLLKEEGAQAQFAGGNLPNLRRDGPVLHRVELGEEVTDGEGLRHQILENLLPGLFRGWSWS